MAGVGGPPHVLGVRPVELRRQRRMSLTDPDPYGAMRRAGDASREGGLVDKAHFALSHARGAFRA